VQIKQTTLRLFVYQSWFWNIYCSPWEERLWLWAYEQSTNYKALNEFLVSKETVVLHRWERSKQKFDFIKRVDKGEITTVKDLES